MPIQLLDNNHIDHTKWNTCIEIATNGMPYAYTWYIDIICQKQWMGLVLDDYDAVMPLPYNQKLLGIKQVYQPFFAQQLGVFGKEVVTSQLLMKFLKAIPTDFKKLNCHLNEGNHFDSTDTFTTVSKSNYLLPLSDAYETIYANYATLQKRNIKKAKQYELSISEIDINAFVKFYIANPTNKNISIDHSLITRLKKLLTTIQTKNMGYPIGVKTKEGSLCAACFLLKSHQRIIYFLARSTPDGRELRAMPFLIDTIIKRYAESNQILDFEGSSVVSIAEFFRRFGAKKVHFPHLSFNQLPKWMKFLGK